ncbi:MAG TPA: hypothetical protein VGL06_21660, partial [Pseudonocardiaceae bacterium]
MAPETIMPPIGTTTRDWVEITPRASSAPRVMALPAVTPTVAAQRACGSPAPRRPATCPAISTMIVTQANAPGRPVRANSTSSSAQTATNCTPARSEAMISSRV